MYSPVRQVSQSPHSYKHDDNIYTSKSRHEHVMQRIQTFHHQYANLITNRWDICIYIIYIVLRIHYTFTIHKDLLYIELRNLYCDYDLIVYIYIPILDCIKDFIL